MSETAPAPPPAPAPSPAEKTPVKKKARKSTGAAKRKSSGPSVSELITKAVAASKERSGVSLAALKKALAAAGYDVEKNNSRIKLGLKSLVSKGTLVQTKGTGASGSFKLNKAAATGEAKPKKAAGAAKKPKKATGAATPKKTAKKTLKKAKPTGAKKVVKSPKKVKTAKTKATKSPVKAKVNKPKVAKPKSVKPKKATPRK
ncbi:histone H1.4-like isoform X2 [Moschus berezovskii]|uniref:histone H1.4-like isoform X2 n=1 Tax=Moschus berezovskii TaxID=68408 RepID=UPI002443B1E6|nr:histone H1.4-like isoform X2 [Moschus berezovskii]